MRFLPASSPNDPCQSIWNSEYDVRLFIPNSRVSAPDQEKFNTYAVYSSEDQTGEFDTIEEAAAFINQI
ncbi:MAG: hypothetical protein COB15_09480 [Flavobacteriales bacterium]|nr:MAG: hypothetical protein COB15_09480 [Flavobacteriales bacterium]